MRKNWKGNLEECIAQTDDQHAPKNRGEELN
jgi:hypothetical protein